MVTGEILEHPVAGRTLAYARRIRAAVQRTAAAPRELREAKQKIESLEACLRRLTPQPRLTFFVMSIVDHCNLRCKGCDHFAAIAQKRFVSFDDVSRDAARMSELFGTDVEEMRVLGGEPLLHPQLEQILVEVRKCFPETKISLTTNGILLPRQDETFWTACRENRITIVNTKYPINLDHAGIEEFARAHGVAFEYYGHTGEMTKTSFKIPLDLSGGQDPRQSFMRCFHANHAVMVMEGKIFTCTVAPNAHIFRERFGADLALTERDYLDIHKAENKESILEFLATPKPFCRYCDVAARSYGHPWERSKQDMNEWLVSAEDIGSGTVAPE